MLEAKALPTEPQYLPFVRIFFANSFKKQFNLVTLKASALLFDQTVTLFCQDCLSLANLIQKHSLGTSVIKLFAATFASLT